jgi:hypothetical protein
MATAAAAAMAAAALSGAQQLSRAPTGNAIVVSLKHVLTHLRTLLSVSARYYLEVCDQTRKEQFD